MLLYTSERYASGWVVQGTPTPRASGHETHRDGGDTAGGGVVRLEEDEAAHHGERGDGAVLDGQHPRDLEVKQCLAQPVDLRGEEHHQRGRHHPEDWVAHLRIALCGNEGRG